MSTMTEKNSETLADGFRLTGRHVLFILLGVFAFVGAVNAFMIYKAVGSFPGVVTESSYRDSQRFNRSIADAHEQAARGWKVDVEAKRSPDGRVVVRIDARDGKGAPISGVGFKAVLQHPANRGLDHAVPLAAVAGADGVFSGVVTGVTEGKWGLEVEGIGASGRVFLSQNSLFLP